MFPQTSSCSGTKSTYNKWWNVFTLIYPPLWSKLLWIFEIFLRIMIGEIKDRYSSSFFDWKPIQINITFGFS
jgi:hypothetical protein